jgi:hypothetical protein
MTEYLMFITYWFRMKLMGDGKKKPKILTAEELQFREDLLRRIDDAFGNITDEELSKKLCIHRNTIPNWRNKKGSPSPWLVLQAAQLTHRRPAYLAFGELPADSATQHLVVLIAEGLNRSSPDLRQAALRVLNIDPQALPAGTVIQVHRDGVKTFDPPKHTIQLPMAKAQEDPAPYGGTLDANTMHRLCDDLCARVQNPELPLSPADAALYRRIAAVILSAIGPRPTTPTPSIPPGALNVEGETTHGEDRPVSDDGPADDGATP